MNVEQQSILSRRERLRLEDGRELRLLSALEILEAGREADELAQNETERPLCANACLLARALERDGVPVFSTGRAVLQQMSPRMIGTLAQRWNELDRMDNPSPEDGEEAVLALKKAWSTPLMSAFAGACSRCFGPFQRRSGPKE